MTWYDWLIPGTLPAGFSPVWRGFVTGVIGIVSALSGRVLYRDLRTIRCDDQDGGWVTAPDGRQ